MALCPPDVSWGAKYYHVIDGVCTRETSYFQDKAVLSQGVGYGIVLGFGALFAFLTSFLVSPPSPIHTIDYFDSTIHLDSDCNPRDLRNNWMLVRLSWLFP